MKNICLFQLYFFMCDFMDDLNCEPKKWSQLKLFPLFFFFGLSFMKLDPQ